MFPTLLQKSFAWIVPAFIGVLGISSLLAWRSTNTARTVWHLLSGILAVGYAVVTIANLSVQGNDYGNVPFSAGGTGFGPRYVAVDFIGWCCLVAAVSSWALASLSFGNRSNPLTHLKKPLILFIGASAVVGVVYGLLETFG